MQTTQPTGWQFWIDRGGTFTDIIGLDTQGQIHQIKVLSERPEQYKDAAIYGIKLLLGLSAQQAIPANTIESIKMGTTVATNALLEHTGEKTLLCISQGFADILEIGYQARPKLFDLHIQKPVALYTSVVEVAERLNAQGQVITSLDTKRVTTALQRHYQQGLRAIAICLMHAYINPQHEQEIAAIAHHIGFTQISLSHQTSPVIKLIARGDTTVVDAYLSPILKRYIKQVESALQDSLRQPLQFMRSDGGLSQPAYFYGKDAILSGPAGGVIGMVKVGKQAGFDKLIGFDMGGTSTDVCHYHQDYARTTESTIASVRLQTPMMKVHTIAAGGGSILHFKDGRFIVGPDSAGANPGPACYDRGGPLTVTDCNVLLGRINAAYFPQVFGAKHNQPLNTHIVQQKFTALKTQIDAHLQQQGQEPRSLEGIAWGFLQIAVMNMANAIKKISIEEGYDIREHTLCCFGGAAGQHACLVADVLSIKTVLIHPLAGLLSAFGIGLSSLSTIKEKHIDQPLQDYLADTDKQHLSTLASADLLQQGAKQQKIQTQCQLLLRYHTSETTIKIPLQKVSAMQQRFETQHQQLFGFIQTETPIIVDRIIVESSEENLQNPPQIAIAEAQQRQTSIIKRVYYTDTWYDCEVIAGREHLPPNKTITAINRQLMLVEKSGTNLVDPNWSIRKDDWNNLILTKKHRSGLNQSTVTRSELGELHQADSVADPIALEIFNNQFMAIAEQMGSTLAKTAQSVNIRERLDFSCALFNAQGELVANANHIPVHLGSMSESVRCLIQDKNIKPQPGNVYMLNNPYQGGTHLPDITVITPVFDQTQQRILFFTAARGHHADIGGIEPGSCPAFSNNIDQEGIVISNVQIVQQGKFLQDEVISLLSSTAYPCRNIAENIADIKAQIAANECGAKALQQLMQQKGESKVLAYMRFVQDNAENIVKQVISKLPNHSSYCYHLDNGSHICVKLSVNQQNDTIEIDFSGTSKQHDGNFNAPIAICHAAVLYVFRCLIDKNIPLNQGCLKPIRIIAAVGTILNPRYPAAVIAGNTEVSQAIVECLFAALGILAGSQGTMNNYVYGTQHYQNYETICGGTGAGNGFHGASAVHSHMTNTRMTDPEVLEKRYPVRIEEFSIRKGSGGKGKYTGGDGVIRRMRFLQAMQVNVITSNRIHRPFGLHGGNAGLSGKNYLERPTATGKIKRIPLNGTDRCQVLKNDIFTMHTPGGGGYGPPKKK